MDDVTVSKVVYSKVVLHDLIGLKLNVFVLYNNIVNNPVW